MTDLNELKKLAEEATPGQWALPPNVLICTDGAVILSHGGDNEVLGTSEWVRAEIEDLEFIAAANPTTVLDLIARLERAEKALAECSAMIYNDVDSMEILRFIDSVVPNVAAIL